MRTRPRLTIPVTTAVLILVATLAGFAKRSDVRPASQRIHANGSTPTDESGDVHRTHKPELVLAGGPAHKHGRILQNRPGVIDGTQTPELIPDDAAYSILFRVLGNSRSPEAYRRAAAYVRYAMHIDGAQCLPLDRYPNAPVARRPTTDIVYSGYVAHWPTSCPSPSMRPVAHRDQILDIARRYTEHVSSAEESAKQYAVPGLGASAGAAGVASAKRQALSAALAALGNELKPELVVRVQTHVRTRMKPKMKIFPAEQRQLRPSR